MRDDELLRRGLMVGGITVEGVPVSVRERLKRCSRNGSFVIISLIIACA
jgi:hypothetical protein